jgi:predicted methyltransferase
MKFQIVTNHCLTVIVFTLAVWQGTSEAFVSLYVGENTVAWPVNAQGSADNSITALLTEPNKVCSTKPSSRAESVHALLSFLSLGEGSVVADIGAGGGTDTWTFANIVGKKGLVFAQEISGSKVKKLEEEAHKKGLSQVCPVLGRTDDPCLPSDSADLVFVHHVFHHFAKPREMLRGLWYVLKPGGYLVVVDKRRGTLRDWVPNEQREKKHFWTAETTVVREAREEGFAFNACAEQCWHTKDDFVLIFQRPREMERPGQDPDSFLSIPVKKCAHQFLPLNRPYQYPVFVALGGARKLMGPILKRSSGKALEIILEEWATQKEERPCLPHGVSLPSVLTRNGDPNLGEEPIDVVFFLDTYHLLFHAKTLLAKIHEKLMPGGYVYILDRRAEKPLSRREASHRRMIGLETVKQEMTEAGFYLWNCGPRITSDRFLLVFCKDQHRKALPED